MRIGLSSIGIMGTGTNFFRCGVVHSSGVVYIGTYGPEPAIVWKYDPRTGVLTEVGRPGEYQLDSMVEAPNGAVYIGTAYSGIVYRLDPATDRIISIGAPPIDSTPWIFTMVRTRDGDIYGARGVGLFHLDWQHDRLEAVGLVPGDHMTPGPNSSMPIVWQLEEAPDGTFWGGTNRWLFRFDPRQGTIEPLVDMVSVDSASYALYLAGESAPTADCYFGTYARFSGRTVAHPFYVYRAAAGRLEPLPVEGWTGTLIGLPSWWGEGTSARLLAPAWYDEEQRVRLAVVDPWQGRVEDRWDIPGQAVGAQRLPGPGLYYNGSGRGCLLQVLPGERRVVQLAENPVPVDCRCLAVSRCRVLGADTYDCGCMVTRDLASGQIQDHGRVWLDDHRCNYGPAAFAGADGRYFLANHSEGMSALWVTDTIANRHWRVGEAAVQLVALADGTVLGTAGSTPSHFAFDPAHCWTANWQAQPGPLFQYRPGAATVEPVPGVERCGALGEIGGGRVVLTDGCRLSILDLRRSTVTPGPDLPADAVAAAADVARGVCYLSLGDRSLLAVRWVAGGPSLQRAGGGFGAAERGFFVLPFSGRLVSIGNDGAVTIREPGGETSTITGPLPLPAGPAVDPTADAWYFAGRDVVRYSIE